jgi:hypothetical protein
MKRLGSTLVPLAAALLMACGPGPCGSLTSGGPGPRPDTLTTTLDVRRPPVGSLRSVTVSCQPQWIRLDVAQAGSLDLAVGVRAGFEGAARVTVACTGQEAAEVELEKGEAPWEVSLRIGDPRDCALAVEGTTPGEITVFARFVAEPPTVASVIPRDLQIGHEIELRGTNLNCPGQRLEGVRVGDAWAEVIDASFDRATAIVPSGARHGGVSVECGPGRSPDFESRLAERAEPHLAEFPQDLATTVVPVFGADRQVVYTHGHLLDLPPTFSEADLDRELERFPGAIKVGWNPLTNSWAVVDLSGKDEAVQVLPPHQIRHWSTEGPGGGPRPNYLLHSHFRALDGVGSWSWQVGLLEGTGWITATRPFVRTTDGQVEILLGHGARGPVVVLLDRTGEAVGIAHLDSNVVPRPALRMVEADRLGEPLLGGGHATVEGPGGWFAARQLTRGRERLLDAEGGLLAAVLEGHRGYDSLLLVGVAASGGLEPRVHLTGPPFQFKDLAAPLTQVHQHLSFEAARGDPFLPDSRFEFVDHRGRAHTVWEMTWSGVPELQEIRGTPRDSSRRLEVPAGR